ncbi:hypothetical protein EsH8_X_000736 [Colletotrichum jinshuiense]
MRTHRRQPALPATTMTDISLSALQQSIESLRKDHPVRPYSETQARFWLGYMKMDFPGLRSSKAWDSNEFGIDEQWDSADDALSFEPELDGTRKSEVV